MSNLIPVPRKEQYLSKIDGMTNKSPDKTYTKEEYFFSEILGEALHKPVLETRYEMYLAKIAGREIEIPYPETRLERFLAKAAGMNISVPTPITREEMYWSTYSPFYLSNSSGTSPLTYGKCKIGTLSNYRIYGNTVSGESVGDKTGNLFNGEFLQGYWAYANGMRYSMSVTWITTSKLPCKPNTDYSFKSSYIGRYFGFVWFDSNGEYISSSYVSDISSNMYVNFSSLSPVDATYLIINIKSYSNTSTGDSYAITPSDVTDLMLNEGSTPLPYEPYGYKVPVTVSDGTDTLTTNLYLPEQIRKVGDEAEYIDYGEQKLHRVRKNLLPNTATSQTINGVEITINANGSVTCNGQATGVIYFKFNSRFTLPVGEFVLTGCPTGGGNSSYRMYIQSDNLSPQKYYTDIGNGVTIDNTNAGTVYNARILIVSGYTCNNLTFYPMIRLASIKDDTYEPYIENTDLDVTLPALPTLTGTNVLSVGTEVQPSHIFAEFDKEREYG